MCLPASESCELHKKCYGSSRTSSYGVGLGGLCLIFTIPICSKIYRLCLKLCPKFAYYAQTTVLQQREYIQFGNLDFSC